MATADGRIFISYRRQETAWPARQLYEALCERFGVSQVFKDVDNIAPGEDFVERISTVVGSCRVLLAMIGPHWLEVVDEDGNRRIDDPDDFVRLEVASALSRGVLVVPILVDGARMPKSTQLPPDLAGLARRQAIEINPTGFNLERLFQALDDALAEAADQPPAEAAEPVAAEPEPAAVPSGEPAPFPPEVALVQPEPAVEEPEPEALPPESVVQPEPEPLVDDPFPPELVVQPEPEPLVEEPDPFPPELVVQPEPEPMPEPVVEPPPTPVEVVPPPPVGGEPPPPPPEPVEEWAPPVPPPSRSRLPLVIGGVAVLAVAGGIAAWQLFGNGGPEPTPSQLPSITVTPSPTAPEPVDETVTVDDLVVPTGVACTTGRVLSLTATGEISIGARTGGPDGAAGWFDDDAPLPDAPLEALIVRVGEERFFVGDTLTLVCPGDGELELGTNSLPGTELGGGSLTAEIVSHDDLTAGDIGIVTLTVPATQAWVDSGFECSADTQFRVSATGRASAEGAPEIATGGPDGVRLRDGEIFRGQVLRTAAHRALLGRVDEGDPFLVGSSATLQCPADGVLELQVNDGVLEDNTGEFRVTLSRWSE